MRKPPVAFLLALAGCGSEDAPPAPSSVPAPPVETEATAATPTPLPPLSRAIVLTVPGGPFRGSRVFGVAQVEGLRVRLRVPLCDSADPGVWVNWRTVVSWNDAGPATGDDRNLGLPMDLEYRGR